MERIEFEWHEEKNVEIDPELKKAWKEEFGFENPVVIKNPFLGRFHQRFTHLKKAVSKLQENQEFRKNKKIDQKMEEILRDSDMRRFEFTYELSWKTLKEYLKEEGMAVESTPRGILKQAFGVGLLKEDAPWLSMISDRNQTCHEYNQEVAVELVERIQRMYLPAFQTLVETLEKEGNP